MSPTSLAEQIRKNIESGDYQQAYRLGAASAKDGVLEPDVLEAMLSLTGKLRSICIGMGYRKADSGPGYFAIEDLLREASKFTEENIYGRRQ